ncbi:hypothetical protein D6D13_00633 [Aureobasidium pullulans]|uniref:Uncharacterized protein n=1 Tax=Aureobasidium pullulans TaxID=5580 RepID=A0A4S9DAZ0_AURPU|nr:hypothetical protein D6D13_00633 [Aureobasidium pullulans]
MGLSAFGGPHGALIGKAVKLASKGASSTMSSKRSKVFLEEVNRDIFTPHGLKVEILPTHQMLQIIGCPPDQFKSSSIPPPWTTPAAGDDVNSFAMHQQEQAQVMRMRALDGSVMPLTYHTTAAAPAAANTDKWLKRMGEKQAAKKTASQTAKKSENYADAHAKRDRKIREAGVKYNEEMSYEKEAGKPEKQAKARREFNEEMRKLEREEGGGKMREDIRDADKEVLNLQKDENKEAEHLCWIVVTPLGWGNTATANHGAAMRLKAGDKVKKHFITSLFG